MLSELLKPQLDDSYGTSARRLAAAVRLSHRPWAGALALAGLGLGAARCEAQASALAPEEIATVTVKGGLPSALEDNDVGVAYANGYGLPRDDRMALDHFSRACAGGSADGCSNQGAMIERGRGAPVDLDEALRLYRRACEGGSALGCSNLGALYLETAIDEAERTYSRRLFEWACQTGSATGCENRAALERRRAWRTLGGA